MTLRYPIKLAPDDNRTLLVTCPLLPEVTTFGEDEADAKLRAIGAIEEALAARIADGADIPLPLPTSIRSRTPVVAMPLMTELKVRLYCALREAGVTRAVLARRLGWNRESVDRLFRLDHASRLEQIEAAFKALDCRVDVSIENAA
jgi:antitoxin HicB